MGLPSFILEIYSHDQRLLSRCNVTDISVQLTYANIMDALRRYLPGSQVNAFKYLDEEGDFITVRTDRETAEMIKSYVLSALDRQQHIFTRALVICPSNDSLSLNSPDLHVQVPSSGSPMGRISTEAAMSSSPHNQHSASPSEGSRKGSGMMDSPHTNINLQNIMNGPISSDPNRQPLSANHLEYDPASSELGRGNGGNVYKAIHKPTGKLVALKSIRLDTTSTAVQKQIISELAILNTCKSPFIISFIGAFFSGYEIHIATEYMDGGSLDQYKPINEQALGRIAVMVVHGLLYLWTMEIMHRDVKPSNMLVNSKGLVKLCDFGVSRQLISSTAITYCGTYAYMSPERLNQYSSYKIQSDLWSLGVSLFEMLTGDLPYPEVSLKHPMKLFEVIEAGKVSQLTRGDFGLSTCSFIHQCMSKLPDSRPHPRTLIEHPFIAHFNDGNTDIVAQLVRSKQH